MEEGGGRSEKSEIFTWGERGRRKPSKKGRWYHFSSVLWGGFKGGRM